jgi:hypothetical protein
VVTPVSDLPHDCDWPAVACSTSPIAMIAWVATVPGPTGDTAVVHTQLVPALHEPEERPWAPPTEHGPGEHLALCWSREGFTLAYVRDGAVVLRQSDTDGVWDPTADAVLAGAGDLEAVRLDLWGNAFGGSGAHVMLAVGGSRWEPDVLHRILYAGRTSAGWSSLATVTETLEAPVLPRMSFGNGPYGPLPRIYYVGRYGVETNLVYTTRNLEGVWDGPWPVPGAGGSIPGPVATEFDVVQWDIAERAVLGTGHQPTCPCNTIHYVRHTFADGWLDPEPMTVDHGLTFDWPMSPNVSVDLRDRVHAFWYQQAADAMMQPRLRTLEYWIQEDGVWTEAGGFLDDQEGGPLGSRVALALAPGAVPVLAWTRRDTIQDEPQPRAVWIARSRPVVAVPEAAPPPAVRLVAWPNPFNPRVTLEFEMPAAGNAELTVYDLRGRRLAELHAGPLRAGSHRRRWDGTDVRGRALPGGVYLARLTTGSATVCSRLVLVR